MKPIGRHMLSIALALLVDGTLAQSQDRGRGGNAQEAPTLKGRVAAYEMDNSIALETKARGGGVQRTDFALLKDKTRIELVGGIKAVEPGMMASVWADKDNPKNAVRVVVEPEPPTAKGKVVAYDPDRSITLETPVRGGGVTKTEFAIVKGKTQVELGAGATALEVGMTVSVWADKDNSNTAAKVAAQGVTPPARGRGGAGAPPPPPGDRPKPAGEEPAKPAAVPDVQAVLKAYKDNLPTDRKLEWYSLDWVNTLGEAKERAAKENRPILFIHTNKEGDLFCSLC